MAFSIPQQFLNLWKRKVPVKHCDEHCSRTSALMQGASGGSTDSAHLQHEHRRRRREYNQWIWILGGVNSYPWISTELKFQTYHYFIWLNNKVKAIKIKSEHNSVGSTQSQSPEFLPAPVNLQAGNHLHSYLSMTTLRKLSPDLDKSWSPPCCPSQ